MKRNTKGDYLIDREEYLEDRLMCPESHPLTESDVTRKVETFGEPTLKGIIVDCGRCGFSDLLHFSDTYEG